MMRRVLSISICAMLLAALCGCASKDGSKKQKPSGGSDSDSDHQAAPASPLSNPMAVGFLANMLEQSKERGPFDPPRKSKDAQKTAPYHAVLALSGTITELDAPFRLFGGSSGSTLRALIARLHELLDEKNVESVLLRVDGLGLSYAVAEELRAALAAHAKPVHCHVESASDLTYMVLTACDSIALAPTGSVAVTGPAAMPMYLRGLLDKVGLQTDFLHIGAYKGAAEPLTRTAPSDQMKETYNALLDGAYARLSESIAQGRKVNIARAKEWIDQAIFTDKAARTAGLVDEVVVFEDWRQQKVGDGEWMNVALDEHENDMAGLLAMLGAVPRPKITQPHLALLYAVGEVVDGSGSGMGSANQEIASRRLSGALRAVADDESVKVIVMRVDSPGGSALASELIWHAVEYAKSKKPVVVSMGNLAASGGYYISAGANRIWAQPDTLTGSIGVVGGKIVLGPALENIGINIYEMGRGKRAMLMSPVRKWTADERAAIEATMQDVYGTFKQRVSAGRKIDAESLEKIAQGRVWIGADAKQHGLVDELGGLEDAIADARKLGSIDDDAPISVYPPEPTLMELVDQLSGSVRVNVSGDLLSRLDLVLGPRFSPQILGVLTSLARFQQTPVRLMTFFPRLR